jgi:hydrogenase small subunit
VTHAACANRHFNEIPGVWPIGTGVPCFGCTEKGVVWQMGTFETVPIHLATPPETYPPIFSTAGQLKVGAAGLVGAIAGAVGGAAWVASQRFHSSMEAGVARIATDRAHFEKLKAAPEQPADKKED